MNAYKLAILGQTILVITVIIIAFTITGSPFEARKEAYDIQRLTAFTSIRYSIDNYVSTHSKLPESLDEVKVMGSSTSDPETKQLYDFKPTGEYSYQLCTTFSSDSEKLYTGDKRYLFSEIEVDFKPGEYACVDYEVSNYIQEDARRSTEPEAQVLPTRTPSNYSSPVPIGDGTTIVNGIFNEAHSGNTQISILNYDNSNTVYTLSPTATLLSNRNETLTLAEFQKGHRVAVYLDKDNTVTSLFNHSYSKSN